MTLRWARSPVAPNSTNVAGSGTRSRRRPSRSGLAGLVAGGRFLPSDARRRSRIVRGASFFAGAGAAGASGLAGSPGFAAGVRGFVGVLVDAGASERGMWQSRLARGARATPS